MLESYLLFIFKLLTLLGVGIFLFIGLIGILVKKGQKKDSEKGLLKISKVASKFENYESILNESLMKEDAYEAWKLEKSKSKKNKSLFSKFKFKKKEVSDAIEEEKFRLFVIDFDGDMRASDAPAFQEKVTSILLVAQPEDRVLIRLESAGGLVHEYGFAASQIVRLREHGLYCVVSIDRVAASGGYLMACVANEIIASPFSVIGSIGVIAQLPNFHKLLKKNNIDFEQHTAGKYKRTLTMFGENTSQGREKFLDDLESVHDLFKNFVTEYRPQLNMDQVATGEIWYGKQALEYQLIDQVMVGDSYLQKSSESYDIFEVKWEVSSALMDRLFDRFMHSVEGLFLKFFYKDKVALFERWM